MFTAYFDASGTRLDSQIVTIAGFVSDATQWLKFEEEWTEILHQFDVPYLHMKEFAHFKGPFKEWRGQESMRRSFLDRLSGVLVRRVHHSVCRNVRVKDFDALNLDYPLLELIGTPIAFAGLTSVGAVTMWRRRCSDDQPTVFIFEDGDHDKEFLIRALVRYYDINPAYKQKAEHIEFQAADWLAYEHRNLSSDWIQKDQRLAARDYRRSLTILYDRLPHDDWGDIGKAEMEKICQRLAMPSRKDLAMADDGGSPR